MKEHFAEAAPQGDQCREAHNSPQKLHFKSKLDKVTPRKATVDKNGKGSMMTQDRDDVEVSEEWTKSVENMGDK
mgnify:CR=1 FL=1